MWRVGEVMEDKVVALEIQHHTLTAELKLLKREVMEAEEERRRLRNRLDEREKEARLGDALIKQLTEETHRIREEASREMERVKEEVNEYRRRESERRVRCLPCSNEAR